jgi:hypothetical protein
MRASRRKTLVAIVSGAMKMQGTGVLACGAFAKHPIKRVERFLGNTQVEVEFVFKGLFSLLRGTHKSRVDNSRNCGGNFFFWGGDTPRAPLK